MRAMIIKEFRELGRDRRTLAMAVMMPIVLLLLFGYAANFQVDDISTAVIGEHAQQVSDGLPELFDVRDDVEGDDPETMLRENRVDAVVDSSQRPVKVYLDGSALFVSQSAQLAIGRSGGALESEVLFNPDLETSWVIVPAIIGLVMALIGTMITSLGLVREKESGTLEQLAVMPIRPSAVILGKIAPYFTIALIDITIITLLGIWLFGVPFNGPIWVFALGAVAFLCVVLGLGILSSTISSTAGQAMQTALFFMLPQILLSGMIFPLEAMPWAIRWIGQLLPLTYFINVSHGVLLRGAGIAQAWPSIVVLAAMALFVLTASTLRFRAMIAPRRTRARSPRHAKAA